MIGIILQARMGSRRLPGKVLKQLGEVTMLEYIMNRLSYMRTTSACCVVATSTLPQDDCIAELCIKKNINCFRGSEENVLERYYQCAKKYKMEYIIRITGDNPFVDVEELDKLIIAIRKGKDDYINMFEALPYGVGAEIFTYAALRENYNNAKRPSHFEHVNEYFIENPEKFRMSALSVIKEKNRPDVRLTVDSAEDYERAQYIVAHGGSQYISTQEAIEICSHYV